MEEIELTEEQEKEFLNGQGNIEQEENEGVGDLDE